MRMEEIVIVPVPSDWLTLMMIWMHISLDVGLEESTLNLILYGSFQGLAYSSLLVENSLL